MSARKVKGGGIFATDLLRMTNRLIAENAFHQCDGY